MVFSSSEGFIKINSPISILQVPSLGWFFMIFNPLFLLPSNDTTELQDRATV